MHVLSSSPLPLSPLPCAAAAISGQGGPLVPPSHPLGAGGSPRSVACAMQKEWEGSGLTAQEGPDTAQDGLMAAQAASKTAE